MSGENHLTVEAARARLCPFLDRPCVAEDCMAWLWGWRDRDGYENHREEQAHWSELAAGMPDILPTLLTARGVSGEDAATFSEQFKAVLASKPADPRGAIEAAESPLDDLEEPPEVDEDDEGEVDSFYDYDSHQAAIYGVPLEFITARREWSAALNTFMFTVNRAIEAVTTPEMIAEYAITHAPDASWTPQDSGISNAIIFAKYVRPRLARGYCGRVSE